MAPVIGGGILVSTRIESFADIVNDTWLVAQNLDTGAELWSTQLPLNFPDSWWSHILAIRDGHVYASRAGNVNSEYLYALDPANGSVVWHSEALISSYGTETPAFTTDGDLIVGNFTSLVRIDHTDGGTVWQTTHQCLASGGCEPVVAGNRVYVLEGVDSPSGLGYVLAAYDAATGQRLYASEALRTEFFGINQLGLLAGPGGAVYVPLSNNTPGDALVALADSGTALVETWRTPIGYVPVSTFAVGPDGTVYSYSTDNELLRLDPFNGNVLATSLPIPFDGSAFSPRLAIDSRARVFLSNASDATGMLLAFDADLKLRWTESVPGIVYGGPAIGREGTLVVEGSGTTVRAYRTTYSGDSPLRVDAHTNAATVSNGNGVLEPGETVMVEPSWENGTDADASLAGTAVNLTGPGSGAYTIEDAVADYGLVAAGTSANCFDATSMCERVTVGSSGARPATHWDATFDESLSPGFSRTWTLHVGSSFDDIQVSDPFYPYVETVLHRGVTAGCDTTTYCRNAAVTRAQMAVFLLKGRHGAAFTPPTATGTKFDDVPSGSFAADWIEELAAQGITGGCSAAPSLYCPNASVTRAQMAVFLLKTEHGRRFVPPPCAGNFTDVACPGAFAADWIERLAAEAVTAGCGGGDYCPDSANSRGQMAAFLVKTFGLSLYGP